MTEPTQEIIEPKSELTEDPAIMHICYAMLVAGYFTGGLTSIVAVILAYVKRSPTMPFTFSHLTWIIRTFWIAFIGGLISIIMVLTIILIPLAWILGPVLLIWTVFRIAKGWLRLLDKKPIETPHSYL